MAYKFVSAPVGHQQNLALFSSKPVDTGIESAEGIEFRPVSQITKGAPIEFYIPGSGITYTDLKSLKLHVKVRITKRDGSPITPEDKVSFVNAPLHDSNFRWKSVDKCAAAANKVYKLLDADGKIVVRHPDSDHNFPEQLREESYKLIDSVLQLKSDVQAIRISSPAGSVSAS